MSAPSPSYRSGLPACSRICKAKIVVVRVAAVCTRLLLSILHRLMFRRLVLPGCHSAIKRILVYRIGNVGDLIVAIPTLALIRARFQLAHICLLTSPGHPGAHGATELICSGGWVDSV